MKLRSLMGAEEMQRLQLDEARRGIEIGRSIQDLISGRPDLQGDALINEVAKRDWKRAEEMRKAALEAKKTQAGIGKDEAETRSKNFKITRDMLPAVNDQAAYDVWREGVARLLGPDQAQALPAQFSPDTRNALLMSADEWLKRNAPTIAEKETGRHNLATEANAAGTLGVAQGNLAVSRERLAFDKDQPKGVYDPERGVIVDPRAATAKPVTAEGGQPLPAKLPESSKKELASIDAQANTIAAAIEGVKKTPSAFGMARGAATMAGATPETIAGRMDSPAEREARSFVFNVVSKVINERAGAAQSVQELARLRAFLPAEMDKAEQIVDKLHGFQKYLAEQRKAYAVAPGAQPATPPTPKPVDAPTVFNSMPDPAKYAGKRIEADDGTIYKSIGGKWVKQ